MGIAIIAVKKKKTLIKKLNFFTVIVIYRKII